MARLCIWPGLLFYTKVTALHNKVTVLHCKYDQPYLKYDLGYCSNQNCVERYPSVGPYTEECVG